MMSSRSGNPREWEFRPIGAFLWGTLAVVVLLWYWDGWHSSFTLSGRDRDENLDYHIGISVLFMTTITLALIRMWTTRRRRNALGILSVGAAIGTYLVFAFSPPVFWDDDNFVVELVGGVLVILAFLTALSILISWAVSGVRLLIAKRRARSGAAARPSSFEA